MQMDSTKTNTICKLCGKTLSAEELNYFEKLRTTWRDRVCFLCVIRAGFEVLKIIWPYVRKANATTKKEARKNANG